jgi:hypothetical protein
MSNKESNGKYTTQTASKEIDDNDDIIINCRYKAIIKFFIITHCMAMHAYGDNKPQRMIT